MFKSIRTSLLSYSWVAGIFVASLVFFLIGWIAAPLFLAFAAGVFSVGIVLMLYLVIVDKVLGDVNDHTEIIVYKNVAYAEYVKGIAIIISVAYLAAFFAFLSLSKLVGG